MIKNFLKKYIPEGKQNQYAKLAGLSKPTIINWKKYNNPRTFELICLCKVIAQQQNLNFLYISIEAIKSTVISVFTTNIDVLPQKHDNQYKMEHLFDKYAPNLKYIANTGFSYSQIRHWKNGRATPKPKQLYKLCFVMATINNIHIDIIISEAINLIWTTT
jgi:DNA-binding XRE family transcriptional regulator